MIDDFIMCHPAVEGSPEIQKIIERGQMLIASALQTELNIDKQQLEPLNK
jgi:hypothetical protein